MGRNGELPAGESDFRAWLKKHDAHMYLVYIVREDYFHGYVSAERLREEMISRGYDWARKDRSTHTRWLQKIDGWRVEFMQKPQTGAGL